VVGLFTVKMDGLGIGCPFTLSWQCEDGEVEGSLLLTTQTPAALRGEARCT